MGLHLRVRNIGSARRPRSVDRRQQRGNGQAKNVGQKSGDPERPRVRNDAGLGGISQPECQSVAHRGPPNGVAHIDALGGIRAPDILIRRAVPIIPRVQLSQMTN